MIANDFLLVDNILPGSISDFYLPFSVFCFPFEGVLGLWVVTILFLYPTTSGAYY